MRETGPHYVDDHEEYASPYEPRRDDGAMRRAIGTAGNVAAWIGIQCVVFGLAGYLVYVAPWPESWQTFMRGLKMSEFSLPNWIVWKRA